MQKEIARISKNSQEEVIVQLTKYKEYDLVDVRVWIKPLEGEDGEPGKPTKKGISLNPSILPELIEALKRADELYQDVLSGKTKAS